MTNSNLYQFKFLDLPKYQPDENGKWACLGHPEIVLSFSQVNDDICDCPDGSDEPGTAACPGNWFYCRNEGHIPGRLPASRVNDGVCDYEICCDGSDEQGLSESLNNSGIEHKCENRCAQMHKEYLEKIQKQQAMLKSADANRQKLVKKAAELKASIKKELDIKMQKLASLQSDLSKKEKALKDVELAQAEVLKQRKSDPNFQQKQPELIIKAKETLDSISRAHKASLDSITKLNSEIAVLSNIIETMKKEYNPNFNDPAVKQAIRDYEEYMSNIRTPEAQQQQQQQQQESYTTLQQLESVPKLISDLESFKVPTPKKPNLRAMIIKALGPKAEELLKKFKVWLAENGLYTGTSFSSDDEENPEDDQYSEVNIHKNIVKKARTEVEELEKQLSEIRSDYDSVYGPGDILRSLKDSCVSNNLGEYIYEFCFYGGASQKSTKDNSVVNLGKFAKVTYDDPANKLVLEYENGAKCWSGPIRRVTVSLDCGKNNEILQVTEPERCEYFMRGTSPAACSEYREEDDSKIEKLLTIKDEL